MFGKYPVYIKAMDSKGVYGIFGYLLFGLIRFGFISRRTQLGSSIEAQLGLTIYLSFRFATEFNYLLWKNSKIKTF